MQLQDETLLEQFKQGDLNAFRVIVERYTRPMYNLAFRLLHDSMDAENVTQETFLRVITALSRMRLDLPFKPYLFRIAVNLCYDQLRREKPMLFSEIDATTNSDKGPEPASELIEGDEDNLLDRLEAEELRAQLLKAIETIPANYQSVILLRYVEEMSYDEIARTLELPVNTVRTQLRRAKARLRLRMTGEILSAPGKNSTLRFQTAHGEAP